MESAALVLNRGGGTVQVSTTGLTAPGPSEEGLYSSAIRVSESAKNAPAFLLWWALNAVDVRGANPDCGFLPQHENSTQTGMECQDAVADGGKWEKITENVCEGLSGLDG